ncbi:hypothetical protein D8O27_00495 [Burkholderia mallei]|uniref:hypothetical protein n=1 Tax=Burkholderia mallei TaxID=13373 RepID=UPI000EAAA1D9|nr:hypothetical protein [Burkholderia mallei]RKO17844.1 hypothetical protein D8O04_02915 [Burkholderia mallei]RKO28788.1 hypothetical protein D8O30_00495 [Burkholderia mallei]RKO35833.1 hypothetical protein D8O27_00495 [Burkholderia mallei]RKO44204.1 hypothetical protein D8O06_04475 [Burkholderia mallei]
MRRTRYCSRLRPDASGWAPGGRHRGCPFERWRARRRARAPCVSDGDFRFSSVGFAFSRCSLCGARRSMPCFRNSVLGIGIGAGAGAGAGASIWHSAIGTQFPALGSRLSALEPTAFDIPRSQSARCAGPSVATRKFAMNQTCCARARCLRARSHRVQAACARA